MNEESETDTTELDDAEGHRVTSKIDVAGEPDDAEGHMPRVRFVQPAGEPDDTEGHITSHKR